MTGDRDGVALLAQAAGYALASLAEVTTEALSRPTPCAGWDLRTLLRHVDDSLAALHDGLDTGWIDAEPGPLERPDPDPTPAVRTGARRLRDACAAGTVRRVVGVAGWPLPTGLVAGTGAVEIAVHGWDIARACRCHRSVPAGLAAELLAVVPLVVTAATRYPRFAAPVAVPESAEPGDRLVAFLGRDPDF